MENELQSNLSDVKITYGAITETPFPEGIEPVDYLASNLILVSNGKIFKQEFGIDRKSVV